ncbi:ANKRD50, partial [Symbiodinium sp. KB8]
RQEACARARLQATRRWVHQYCHNLLRGSPPSALFASHLGTSLPPKRQDASTRGASGCCWYSLDGFLVMHFLSLLSFSVPPDLVCSFPHPVKHVWLVASVLGLAQLEPLTASVAWPWTAGPAFACIEICACRPFAFTEVHSAGSVCYLSVIATRTLLLVYQSLFPYGKCGQCSRRCSNRRALRPAGNNYQSVVPCRLAHLCLAFAAAVLGFGHLDVLLLLQSLSCLELAASTLDFAHPGFTLSMQGASSSVHFTYTNTYITSEVSSTNQLQFYVNNQRSLSLMQKPTGPTTGNVGGALHGLWYSDHMLHISDRRLKKSIHPLATGLDERASAAGTELSPVTVKELSASESEVIQESSDERKIKGIAYQDLIAVMVAGVQPRAQSLTSRLEQTEGVSRTLSARPMPQGELSKAQQVERVTPPKARSSGVQLPAVEGTGLGLGAVSLRDFVIWAERRECAVMDACLVLEATSTEAKVFVMNMHVEKVVRLRWRKSHVAKVKDEFRHVEEPGQIFSAAETVEPRKITGSVGSFHSKRRREERCLRAVPGKGRFRLYISVASRVNIPQFMESHQNEALENAERILGEDCWAQTGDASASDVSDWLTVQRGRDLFLPGWGGFDVPEAFHACQAAGVKGIPSVAELRSHGYLAKFFPALPDKLGSNRIQRLLLAPESLLARYVVQHRSFWACGEHLNRLDEVERHFDEICTGSSAKVLKEEPRKLLNRLARDQAVADHPLVHFTHLASQISVGFDESLGLCQSEMPCFELSVLLDSHAVVRAAQELNNCAADYVRDIRQKRCALVVLRSKKLLAMGEWDLHCRRWSQISEHSDEPVRQEWLTMFEQMEGDWLFPSIASLCLPDLSGRSPFLQDMSEDVVSIFSPEGQECLERICSTVGDQLRPCLGWPSLLPASCNLEAATALLIWTVADILCVETSNSDALEVVDTLLMRRADPQAMTDQGWAPLMFAVLAEHEELAAKLLEGAADVDARSGQTGRTALMLACGTCQASMVRLLIAGKAALDSASRIDGRTALLMAAGSLVFQAMGTEAMWTLADCAWLSGSSCSRQSVSFSRAPKQL